MGPPAPNHALAHRGQCRGRTQAATPTFSSAPSARWRVYIYAPPAAVTRIHWTDHEVSSTELAMHRMTVRVRIRTNAVREAAALTKPAPESISRPGASLRLLTSGVRPRTSARIGVNTQYIFAIWQNFAARPCDYVVQVAAVLETRAEESEVCSSEEGELCVG